MMEDIKPIIFVFTMPLTITAIAGYLMYCYRQHMFEMVCSIGFLAALFSFIIGFEGRNMAAAIVIAAAIIALAIARVRHKP
jgi:asparagine N-glycosylation enzyme membrane subunit Stt3